MYTFPPDSARRRMTAVIWPGPSGFYGQSGPADLLLPPGPLPPPVAGAYRISVRTGPGRGRPPQDRRAAQERRQRPRREEEERDSDPHFDSWEFATDLLSKLYGAGLDEIHDYEDELAARRAAEDRRERQREAEDEDDDPWWEDALEWGGDAAEWTGRRLTDAGLFAGRKALAAAKSGTEIAGAVGSEIRDAWRDREEIWDDTVEGVEEGIDALEKGAEDLYREGGERLADAFDYAGGVLGRAQKGAKAIVEHPLAVGRHLGGKALDAMEDAGEWLGDAITDPEGEVIDPLSEAYDDVTDRLGEWGDAVSDWWEDLTDADREDLWRTFLHEFSLGSMDELSAASRAFWGEEGTFFDRYDDHVTEFRDAVKRFKDENPNASATASFAGVAASMLPLFGYMGLIGRGAKSRIVRGLLSPGERLVTQIPKGGAAFGTVGGLYGFLTGEGGLEKRLEKMFDDAAWFGFLGAVQPFGAGPVDALRRRFADQLSAYFTKRGGHRIAARELAAEIKRQFPNVDEGDLVELVMDRFAKAGRAINLGPRTRRAFRDLARHRAGRKNPAAEALRLLFGARRPLRSLPPEAQKALSGLLWSADPQVIQRAVREGLKRHRREGDWLPWTLQALGWKVLRDSLDPWFGEDDGDEEEAGQERMRRERRAPPRQIPQAPPQPAYGG